MTTKATCTADCYATDKDDHWSYCAMAHDYITTAEDVALARQIRMKWAERTGNHEAARLQAYGITARAAQLGLEPPPDGPGPRDGHWVGAWSRCRCTGSARESATILSDIRQLEGLGDGGWQLGAGAAHHADRVCLRVHPDAGGEFPSRCPGGAAASA